MSNIIITGANQGIGYYLIKELLESGNSVSVLDKEIYNLQNLKSIYRDKLIIFQGSVENEKDIRDFVKLSIEKFNFIDIAIHNACKFLFEDILNTSIETYIEVIDINFLGGVRLVKEIIPHMIKNKKGKIIFSSSGVGVTGFFNSTAYASSKGALESLAKSLNQEYKDNNISFHILHPPLTNTDSASVLPIPKDFKADPEKVGIGLAKNIHSNSFIITNSFSQNLQIKLSYLFPKLIGSMMTKGSKRFTGKVNN